MKKIITITLLLIWSSTFAQKVNIDPQLIKLGWTLVSPTILKKVKDTLTKEIIIKTIPKIIDQDIKGSILEISNAIYKVKNVKVLNKEFLLVIDKNVTAGISAIKQKDYATAVNELVKVVEITKLYLKNGSLEKPENPTPVSITSVTTEKATIVTKKEINGKLHIGTYNDYLFFIPDGNMTIDTVNSSSTDWENFSVTLDNAKTFDLGVARTSSPDLSKISIKMIQDNKDLGEQFKNQIAEGLKTTLGDGQIIKSEVATLTNFKALKYTYLYTNITTSNSSMAYIIVTFQDSTMFMISFETSANDFLTTSKSFDDILKSFYIIGVDNISKSDEKTYSKAYITKISIDLIPFNNNSGVSWDNGFGEYYPDVYYRIVDKSNNILMIQDVLQRKENIKPADLPFMWTLSTPLLITDLKTPVFVQIFDKDFSAYEFVGLAGYTLSDYMYGSSAYPAKITSTNQGTTIAIYLRWE